MEIKDIELKEEKNITTNNFLKNKIELKKQREKEKRLQTIKEYSYVIEDMPEEIKQMLTSRMGNVVITPQESFCSYFCEAIPKYDLEVFKVKFVEVFQTVHIKALDKLVKGKKKGTKLGNDLFWQEFEVLFDGMKGSIKPREMIFTRIKNLFLNIWTILKIFKRAIFGAFL